MSVGELEEGEGLVKCVGFQRCRVFQEILHKRFCTKVQANISLYSLISGFCDDTDWHVWAYSKGIDIMVCQLPPSPLQYNSPLREGGDFG